MLAIKQATRMREIFMVLTPVVVLRVEKN